MEHLQQREWKTKVDFSPAEPESRVLLDRLRAETGLSELVLRVCVARGLRETAAIQEFLQPRLEAMTDPMLIRDMDRAVDRLAQARQGGESVLVFGDYDV